MRTIEPHQTLFSYLKETIGNTITVNNCSGPHRINFSLIIQVVIFSILFTMRGFARRSTSGTNFETSNCHTAYRVERDSAVLYAVSRFGAFVGSQYGFVRNITTGTGRHTGPASLALHANFAQWIQLEIFCLPGNDARG